MIITGVFVYGRRDLVGQKNDYDLGQCAVGTLRVAAIMASKFIYNSFDT